MTDADLVAKKLALIETCVRELRTLCKPADFERDVVQERFAEHTLQIAIQASLDVASHIASDDRLGEPGSNRELFGILSRSGWLPVELAESLARMAGFRNILVHGYAAVNPKLVREVVEKRLGDLLAFVTAIRSRLKE